MKFVKKLKNVYTDGALRGSEARREGVALLKECRDVLGRYREQVEELTQEAEASLRPYEGDPDLPEGNDA